MKQDKPQYGVAIGTPDIVEAISCGCFDSYEKARKEAYSLIQDWEEYGHNKPQTAFIYEVRLFDTIEFDRSQEPDSGNDI